MICDQLTLIANDLAKVLDEWELLGRERSAAARRERRRLLQRAILLSLRGLELVGDEEMFGDPKRFQDTLLTRFGGDPWEDAHRVSPDPVALRLFLAAECRLLRDLGLSGAAIDRLYEALEAALDVVWQGGGSAEDLWRVSEGVAEARSQLEQQLSRLSDEDHDDQVRDRIHRLFELLGGALVVAGDVAVVGPTAPVTGGLSAGGAALSVAVGVEAVKAGLQRTGPRG